MRKKRDKVGLIDNLDITDYSPKMTLSKPYSTFNTSHVPSNFDKPKLETRNSKFATLFIVDGG